MRGEIIHNVQLLRFAAATGVALSHAADLLIPNDAATRWFWSVPWTAGVDLFFVISGFIMVWLMDRRFGSTGAASAFLKRRIIRIVPAYWFFTTLTIAALLLLGGEASGPATDPRQIATSFGFVPWPRADGKLNPIMAHGWTLNYEAFFYLCFALALTLRRGLALLCAAFLVLVLAHPVIPERLFVLKIWSSPIILQFLGGIALAKLYLAGRRLPLGGSLACIALAVIVTIATASLDLGFLGRAAHSGIPALLVAAALILAPEPERLGPVRRFAQLGGDASYTIYLAHYLIIHAVVLIWKAAGLAMPWLGVAVSLAVAIAVSILLYRFLERPVTEYLQRRFGTHRMPGVETVAP